MLAQAGVTGGVLVALLRLAQGLAQGAGHGDHVGAMVYLHEHAPMYPALHASLAPMGAALGALAASAVGACVALVRGRAPGIWERNASCLPWGWQLRGRPLLASLGPARQVAIG